MKVKREVGKEERQERMKILQEAGRRNKKSRGKRKKLREGKEIEYEVMKGKTEGGKEGKQERKKKNCRNPEEEIRNVEGKDLKEGKEIK